ncbi:lecithin retinol acyltransferase family protein [uncultured Ilyobacter sp.]|uniref:lecithin retinol acyltransferase family protein n=1 Tax=uncultured Ilyobacter sp. TaxID=544433 RepID=UPI002AA7AAE6|nr:lecithin retinol acyltransferase family protein [uncultured Ilyobacter sp.]
MARGDHIKVKRIQGVYYHHGIDLGNNSVIHYTGEPGKKSNASVKRTSMTEFLNGGKLEIVNYSEYLDNEATVLRAAQLVGESNYNLFFNNCEHFATYCKLGKSKSVQIEDTLYKTGGTASVVTGTAAGIGTVASAGAVSGLSGAGVMTGLAAIGPGGVVGGIATLTTGPAIAANIAVSKVLKDDSSLTYVEREARKAGRVAAKAGTVAATGGSIAAISSAGTVAGLSGAGITSGLAAIGGTVGGGMVAGTAIAVAAPAVAAVAVGAGIYKAFKWLKK